MRGDGAEPPPRPRRGRSSRPALCAIVLIGGLTFLGLGPRGGLAARDLRGQFAAASSPYPDSPFAQPRRRAPRPPRSAAPAGLAASTSCLAGGRRPSRWALAIVLMKLTRTRAPARLLQPADRLRPAPGRLGLPPLPHLDGRRPHRSSSPSSIATCAARRAGPSIGSEAYCPPSKPASPNSAPPCRLPLPPPAPTSRPSARATSSTSPAPCR
jgi:hypothetical protein